MFLSKIFSKNVDQLVKKGDYLFKGDHFIEARHHYTDAIEKLGDSEADQQKSLYIKSMISNCSNRLAELNFTEAEAALRSGNNKKSIEYLNLARDLADDVLIREKADNLIHSLTDISLSVATPVKISAKHDCTSCTTPHHKNSESPSILPDHLQTHEQFGLLVNTLPGDLPERYLSLGEEFASAYLLAHSERDSEALNKFRELLSVRENDILLYEAALLEFKVGRADICESLLERALSLNSENAVCNLSLAQLYTESGRYDKAIILLKSMMARNILYDNSLITLADIYSIQAENEKAIELLSGALQNPALKKAAAERLVAILGSTGRNEEAQYLFKTYLKGCC
ncbi:MAG: hypothetical protein HXX17_01310 [Geobacteraceae bacterium]|nr:hypothetical protein [Geobacteraceae bacterium]